MDDHPRLDRRTSLSCGAVPVDSCMLSAVAFRFRAPPIVEVVCGFFFSPMAGLDPMAVGKYWGEKKTRGYPTKQLHPPVTDRPGVSFSDGVGPLRCWLLSETEEYVVQIQPDRFYFNWRKRQAEYPHFNDHGPKQGVLTRSLDAFEDFRTFCQAELGLAPSAARVDLAKIDLLAQPEHWSDFNDLAKLLTVVKPLARITKSAEPILHLKLAEVRESHEVHFQMTSALLAAGLAPAIQIETRATTDAGDGPLRDKFVAMNAVVNDVFFDMIEPAEWARFGGVDQ